MICIAIDNGSNNTVGGSCYFSHQAVSIFVEHHIDMVSCVHHKCQTRDGVSGDVKGIIPRHTTTISNVWVISIVIDSDRGHCCKHLKKINL